MAEFKDVNINGRFLITLTVNSKDVVLQIGNSLGVPAMDQDGGDENVIKQVDENEDTMNQDDGDDKVMKPIDDDDKIMKLIDDDDKVMEKIGDNNKVMEQIDDDDKDAMNRDGGDNNNTKQMGDDEDAMIQGSDNEYVLGDDTLPVGETLEMYVSHVESPRVFWVQRVCDEEPIQRLQETIANYCDTTTYDADFKVDVGSMCLARFSDDGNWYRVKATSSVGDDGVGVHFVDFGNSEVVELKDLLKMPKEFGNLPIFAFQCTLSGATSLPEDQDSSEVTSLFRELTGHGEYKLDAEILSKNLEDYTIVLTYNDSNIMELLMNKFLNDVEDSVKVEEPQEDLAVLSPSCMDVEDSVKEEEPQEDLAVLSPSCMELEEGETLTVFVCHAESPTDFWVHRTSDEAIIQKLQQDIDAYCNDECLKKETIEWDVGLLCLAQFSGDEVWYRAQILNDNGDGMMNVRFVDFGNSEMVSRNSLLPIPENFSHFPHLAMQCCLDGIERLPSGQDQQEILSRFNDLTGHGELKLQAQVIDVSDGKFTIILDHNDVDIVEALLTPPVDIKSDRNKMEENAESSLEEAVIRFGEKMDIYISHIVSPSQFWVQLVSCETVLTNLLQELSDAAESSEAPEGAGVFDVGECCIAQYSVDEQWYRSRILAVTHEAETVTVSFVDYGNVEDIPFDKLRKISPRFLAAPPFAYQCRLGGIKVPDDGIWNDAIIEAFKSTVSEEDGTYVVEFVRRDSDLFVVRLVNKGLDVTESLLMVDGVISADTDDWSTNGPKSYNESGLLDTSQSLRLETTLDDDVGLELMTGMSTPKEEVVSSPESLIEKEVSLADLQGDVTNPSLRFDSFERTSDDEEGQGFLESTQTPGSEEESFKDCRADLFSEPELEADITEDLASSSGVHSSVEDMMIDAQPLDSSIASVFGSATSEKMHSNTENPSHEEGDESDSGSTGQCHSSSLEEEESQETIAGTGPMIDESLTDNNVSKIGPPSSDDQIIAPATTESGFEESQFSGGEVNVRISEDDDGMSELTENAKPEADSGLADDDGVAMMETTDILDDDTPLMPHPEHQETDMSDAPTDIQATEIIPIP